MKKNIHLSIFLIMIFVTNTYSQSYPANIRGGSDTKKLIDTCKYAIIYTFKYVQDTVKKEPYYDRQILETGNRYSHYGSIWADKVDSINYKILNSKKYRRPNKNGSDGINPENEAGLKINEKPKYEDYYINYPNHGDLTVSLGIVMFEYKYTERIPKFDWKIQSDTMTILGYKCIKATTTFRGRSYNVWFTPLIPVRQGPWKFNGLPGLILKAADTKKYFEWTAIEIEKTRNQYIYIHELDKKRIITTNRKDVMKLQRKFWEDHAGLLMSQIASGGAKGVFFITQDGSITDKYIYIRKSYIPPLELE